MDKIITFDSLEHHPSVLEPLLSSTVVVTCWPNFRMQTANNNSAKEKIKW